MPPTGVPLLPDLDQETPADLVVSLAGERRNPKYVLGFRSAVRNIGDGPLIISGHRHDRGIDTMVADQAITMRGGPEQVARGVGRLRYVISPDHRHWHLLGFERYELRTPGGSHRARARPQDRLLSRRPLRRHRPRAPGARAGAANTRRAAVSASPRGSGSARASRSGTATTTRPTSKASTCRSPGFETVATSSCTASMRTGACASSTTRTTPPRCCSICAGRTACRRSRWSPAARTAPAARRLAERGLRAAQDSRERPGIGGGPRSVGGVAPSVS